MNYFNLISIFLKEIEEVILKKEYKVFYSTLQVMILPSSAPKGGMQRIESRNILEWTQI